jgi:hypothetical protein
MDEGVHSVGPSHERGTREEPPLHGGLDEDAQLLFDVDDLQSMFSSRVNRGCLQRYCGDGAAKLVYLSQASEI